MTDIKVLTSFLFLIICTSLNADDECPDGRQSLGECLKGLCPFQSNCIRNFCCAYKTVNFTTIQPEISTTIENEIEFCFDGSETIGECIGNYCPPGYECTDTFCCQEGESSGSMNNETTTISTIVQTTTNGTTEKEEMESTILATILISTARSIEDPRPTTTESTTNYSSTTPMPTITFKSNEESEPEYGGITAAGSDKSSSIVDEIEETMTTDFPPFPKPNVCLVGNTIGECIDAQCPKSFECIEGYCCKVTPEIDCKDELKECKRHLCEKEEYREFLEKKCARSCRKCHLLKEKKKSKSKVKEIKEEIKEKSIENSTSYEKSKETPTNTSKKLSSKGRKKNLRCRDSRNDCKEWIQEGFCDSPIYTIEQRKAICGDSCQLC